MDNKVLIIAGMHRSGTSLITQWLHHCGLHVGDKLLGKGIGNDDGHYEDLDFYSFHQTLLKSRNLPVSGFVENSFVGMTEKEKLTAQKMISEKNNRSVEWSWKDPRTCLFLPDYDEFIPQVSYLVIYRNFRSSVSSLIIRTQKVINSKADKDENRSFFSRLWHKRVARKEIDELCRQHVNSFLAVWILYNQQILNFIKTISDERYLVLNYETLIANDKDAFSFLKNSWEFSLNYVSILDIYKPSLISKELNIRYYADKNIFREACRVEASLMEKFFTPRETKTPALGTL